MTNDDNDDGEKAGYKKPPKKHRFKKGQSGNPSGKKKKSMDSASILARELEKTILINENGMEIRITKKQALFTSLTNDSIKGNATARRLLIKILDPTLPEPFVPNETDKAMVEEFLREIKKIT